MPEQRDIFLSLDVAMFCLDQCPGGAYLILHLPRCYAGWDGNAI